MGFRLNPFTGQMDVCGSSTAKWSFNPFSGNLDRDHDTGGFVFNPFVGNLDSIAETPASPTNVMTWGTNYALEWSIANYLSWG